MSHKANDIFLEHQEEAKLEQTAFAYLLETLAFVSERVSEPLTKD